MQYLREIHLADPVQVSILLIAADEKRLHTFEELRHATEGWLSATSENMTVHVESIWPLARSRPSRPISVRALSAYWTITALCHIPRASAGKSRCPRNPDNPH